MLEPEGTARIQNHNNESKRREKSNWENEEGGFISAMPRVFFCAESGKLEWSQGLSSLSTSVWSALTSGLCTVLVQWNHDFMIYWGSIYFLYFFSHSQQSRNECGANWDEGWQ